MIPSDDTPQYPQRIAASTRGMVASAHGAATEAGAEMLASGGNAVDAAVATALALGVCEPQASGLGGQAMLLIHMAQTHRTIALDGSSRSPSRAMIDVYRERPGDRFRGYRATTVPSAVATYGYAQRTYGKLPWARVVEPAIRIAEEGYLIDPLQRLLQLREKRHFKDGNAGDIFLQDGKALKVGALFQQPVLAETLRRIAKKGPEEFYTGETARSIDRDMQKNDGLLRRDDLAQIPWPIARRPLSTRFEGYRVMSSPEPAAGRNLLEMLNIAAQFSERRRDPDTPLGVVTLAEIMRRAQIDRRDRPFDPNFFQQVEDKLLIREEHAKRMARQIRQRLSPPKAPPLQGADDETLTLPEPGSPASADSGAGETTHLSVADAAGNMVGLTQSIERVYGSFVATPELGFIYNDYMSAFDYEDYGHPYYLRPNAVPWASVAPTIVMRGRRPWLVIGSPGSERITTAILQVLLRLLRHPGPLEAVMAPRFHCSMAGDVSLEASMMRDDVPRRLERHGFTIDRREPMAFYLGCVQLVMSEGKTLIGVADPRRAGAAGGPR